MVPSSGHLLVVNFIFILIVATSLVANQFRLQETCRIAISQRICNAASHSTRILGSTHAPFLPPLSRLISPTLGRPLDRLLHSDGHCTLHTSLLLLLSIPLSRIPLTLHDYALDHSIDVLVLNHPWYDFLILHSSLLHSLDSRFESISSLRKSLEKDLLLHRRLMIFPQRGTNSCRS